MNIIDYIVNYSFVRYALAAGVLISLCASLLGVTLVLKRYSYIGDGLSHVAFGGLAIAAALNFSNNLLIVMPITVIIAVILIGTDGIKSRGDSSLAMLSVTSMALGYLIFNKFPSMGGNVSGDVCTSLFGSTAILTLTTSDIKLCIVMAAIVVLFFLLFYNKIFAVTFDETFAYATGVRTKVYKFIIAVITGVVISISMRLVGSLLVSALVVFPAMASMKLFKSFKSVMISSALIAVSVAILGFWASISFDTPVGATIVAGDAIVYALFFLISKIAVRVR